MSRLVETESLSRRFVVYGRPQPQGSTRAYVPKGWTRPVITTDNTRLKPWRQAVSETLMAECGPFLGQRTDPVRLRLLFVFSKPASARKRSEVTVKPDIDKLQRAVLDACDGILYADDAQVVDVRASKAYGSPERVEIEVVGR